MNSLEKVFETMGQEIEAGSARYHWEDDGREYRLMRNGVAVAGFSHAFVDANPMLKAEIDGAEWKWD